MLTFGADQFVTPHVVVPVRLDVFVPAFFASPVIGLFQCDDGLFLDCDVVSTRKIGKWRGVPCGESFP